MKSFKRITNKLSHNLSCSRGYGKISVATSRMQMGISKLLVALPLVMLFCNSGSAKAASGLAAPLPYVQQIYADYDNEIRETTNRADGHQHVDTPALIAKLKAGHISTYAYLVYHAPTDWDDFRLEFLPAAQTNGINVWLYLVPPSEVGSGYVPYGYDYVSWARAAGQLAQTNPVLTALVIDDFYHDETNYFTPSYVNSMMIAAHTYSPGLAFVPVNYDSTANSGWEKQLISSTFVSSYGKYCSGVIMPYLDWSDYPNFGNYSGESAQISKNAGILGNIPLITMIYDAAYSLGGGKYWRPDTNYLTQANIIAQTSILNGTAKGLIQYAMDKSPSSTQFPIMTSLYSKWQDIDGFVRGHDNACWHKHYNGLYWGSWQSLGGTFAADQMGYVDDWAPGASDVFALGTDSNCWYNYCDYGTWSGWAPVPGGGQFSSGAAAVSKGPGQLDIFLRGAASNDCQYISWSNGTWAIESLGGDFIGGFGVCSMGPQTLDVFGRDANKALWYNYFDGTTWHGWSSLGGILESDAIAVSYEPSTLDVFWVGTDFSCYCTYWDHGTWGYETVTPTGPTFTDCVSCGSRFANRLDILTRGSDGNLWENGWGGSGWWGWGSIDVMP